MKKTQKKFKTLRIISTVCIHSIAFLSPMAHAAMTAIQTQAVKNALPGSTEPGVLSNYLTNQNKGRLPNAQPLIHRPEQQKTGLLGPEAKQIKFKLEKIILEDNHVYSSQQLSAIYKKKLHTEISVADLQSIVQDITNYYRNNGYILSRAILPPQHVEHGIVHVRIIEGYIAHVNVIGRPKGAKRILQTYGDQISKSRPLKLEVMEYYLRLANEIPGVEVKAILEPSKTATGAADLNLSADTHIFSSSFSYDNYGTRYIGPNQDTLNASLNSIFRAGDTIRGTYATTTRPNELKFYDVSYQIPLGSHGLRGSIGKNHSSTFPGLDLAILDTHGDSVSYYTILEYPLIRKRSENATLDGSFTYLNSDVTALGETLYDDHIRSIKLGGSYGFVDRLNGLNIFSLHVEKGLNVLGASNSLNAINNSRLGADGIFTKFVGVAGRNQPLYKRFSLFVLINGQYSFNPLLAAEQFAFGGSQQGRGYDPAELIGDKGVLGSVELRMDFTPDWRFLNSLQPYIFYDAGIAWNLKNVLGIESKQSATSTGIGSRFVFTKNFSGNLMIAQPLTKSVSALESIGRGRSPRGFFSIIAAI